MKNSKILLFILTSVILLMLCGCAEKDAIKAPKAINGLLDLSNWDFNSHKSLQLDGSWEFYWNRLLDAENIGPEKPDIYGEVPKTWNNYSLKGENLPGNGFATYRLHIKTDLPANSMLGLRIYGFSSAYKLYINDKLISSNGRVATKASEEKGDYTPKAVFFNIPSNSFDIIIQVSNYHYARGGFWYTMYLGSADGIISLDNLLREKEIFIIGILFVLSMFYLTIYLLSRELYTFYFALMCLDMIFAIDMVGQFLLLRLIPGLDINLIIWIWYSSSTWLLAFFILFIHNLFKSKMSTFIVRTYIPGALIFQIIYTFTPTTIYSRLAYISDLLDALAVMSTVIIVGIGIKKGQKDGWLNITSIAIVGVTYIHDILYWTNYINSNFGELIYIGITVFLVLQMIIQAQRIKQLEVKRTEAELSFLQAQIKPHFLYNTLNTIISVSRYDVDQARELLHNFSNYLRRSFDFKDLSQFVPLKNELELAQAYVEIEKVRYGERINVNFDLPEDLNFKVPRLMLQPIIENAIIHGILPKNGDGQIEVCIKTEGRKMFFNVRDDGVGMDKADSPLSVRNNRGTKVGMANIDKRLKKLYGQGLHINSGVGKGTEVNWFIQLGKER